MGDVPVRLYVTERCPFCRMAERLLEAAGVPYRTHDLTRDPETRQRLASETGWRTVPIIFVGEQLIGGFQELAELARAGKLDRLIAAARG